MSPARTLRRLALHCALLPVPRPARQRIADELEDEYPSVVGRLGATGASVWYTRELASVFGWYLLQRLPRWGRRRPPNQRSGRTAMVAATPSRRTGGRLATTLANVGRDARGAVRGMRQSVGFTLLAVSVLAIGIGANTAVFSVFNWVLLVGAPGVTAPEQLLTLRVGDGEAIYSVGHPFHLELRERAGSLAGLTAYSSISAHVARRGGEPPERVAAEVVTETFFDVLGVVMAEGRGFRAEEGTDGAAARVVVISSRLRRQWFGDTEVIGADILLSGTPFEVIGVTPAGFHGPEHPGETDIWVTLASHEASLPQWGDVFARSSGVWMHMVGRLSDGVSLETARQELDSLAAQIAEEFGAEGWFRAFSVQLSAGTGTYGVRERAVATLRVMSSVVAALLLLTCANVANMVLARATGRQREIAVRRALGATRARLVAQLLVESTMLAALGGAAAVLVSFGMVQMFEGARVVSWMPALRDVPVDLRVLSFALGISLLTGVVFGLAPALTASRPQSLKRGATPGGRLRDGLVVAQLALSVTLFVGAGLLTRTLVNMRGMDLGIERSNLVFFSIDPALQGYDESRTRTLVRRVADNLGGLPGVLSVSASFPEAFGRIRSFTAVARWGEDLEESGVGADNMRVTPAYFDTMGIELIEGATFDGGLTVDSDPARPAVILSEGLARKLFPEGPATGRTLTLRERRDVAVAYEIVGVARDAHLRRLLDEDIDIVYEPFGQRYWPQNIGFQLRSSVAPGAILGEVRRAMLEADATLPAYDVVTAVDKIDGTIAEHRLVAGMSSALAAMALLLAGVGIYGVVATSVRLRFHEIGVRMALGARSRDVLVQVLRRSLALGLIGVFLGLVGGVQAAGLMRSRLYGVEPFDPFVFAGGASVMLLLTVVASLFPARRATMVSPVEVLRHD